MRVTVPIYVLQTRPKDSPAAVFRVRPLFFPLPVRSGPNLGRLLSKLSAEVRAHLDKLGRQSDQREMAEWLLDPLLEHRFLKLSLTLRRRTATVRTLAASFDAGGVRLGFFPELDDLWFDVPRGQSLADRATDVLRDHLTRLEKESPESTDDALFGENVKGAFVTSVEVDVNHSPALPKPPSPAMFLLGPSQPADGAQELYRVGRMLDADYPDDLDQAVLREAEVAEVQRRLADPDRRPVLLLGPRGAGKTAVVHEVVRRRVKAAADEHRRRRRHHVWLLSPQRLISGMSYVGQWEDRLLAILKHAARQDEVLYFDDLLGLYFAGQTSQSSLSAADVLRPVLERREFRLVAEMTPEAFRVLRERDRAMADLFDVVHVREPDEPTTRRVLIAVQRQLEDRHRCEFGPDALPAVLDLQRRYVRDVAMPGKAADLLRRLAASNEKRAVGRAEALAAFQSYTGLSTLFVDQTVRLARADVVADLSRRVVAQPDAVAAMADAVCVAKARLNDPARPVATFLFLGPTGVGKTECAKALAHYLFGGGAAPGAAGEDATDRLLRFDMNEYLDPGSAGRLIGTPRDPDGLLTAAVRRQPFSVVLLDEIEKAHPAVFDLLLGVLGEGRLTDARGRTADFTNCIVVMTSNLGVREAEVSFGLGDPARPGSRRADHRAARDRYVDAAKRFFRPEFFNRIDRVVPFARLGRDDVAAIARRLLDGLLTRQGLTGRRCVMRVDPAALGRIVDAGYHPRLGARALKREVERRIAMPVARRLATLPPGEPTVIDVVPGDADARDAAAQVRVRVTPLKPARPVPPTRAALLDPAWADPAERLALVDDLLDRAEAALARLEGRAEALAPERGMQQGRMTASHFAYLAIREQAKTVGNLIGWIDRVADQAAKPPQRNVRVGARRGPQARPRPAVRRGIGAAAAWRQLVDAEPAAPPAPPESPRTDVPADDVPGDAPDSVDRLRDPADDLLDELALLSAMVEGTTAGDGDPDDADDAPRHLLLLTAWADGPDLDHVVSAYAMAFDHQFGVQVEPAGPPDRVKRELPQNVRAVVVDLPAAGRVLGGEVGVHLFAAAAGVGGLFPVEVSLVPLAAGADPVHAAAAAARRPPPDVAGAVVRVYRGSESATDLRAGTAADRDWADGPTFRKLILSMLAVPAEVAGMEEMRG